MSLNIFKTFDLCVCMGICVQVPTGSDFLVAVSCLIWVLATKL